MPNKMTAEQNLGLYAEGWAQGDVAKILAAAGKHFVFKDPDKISVCRDDFADYFAAFKAGNQPFNAAKFMDISGVATTTVGGRLLAACFWQTMTLKGTGLIVVTREGVQTETVALL